MKRIIPLKGYITATPANSLKSIEEEVATVNGFNDFVVVDSKTGRNEQISGKTRVRLFNVVEVYEAADDTLKNYINKQVYCVCFENEKENNIIIEEGTGRKLFVLPENDILAELKD